MQSNFVVNETLESIEDGFFSLDTNWRFTYLNRKSASIAGRDRETLIGKVVWEEFPILLGSALENDFRSVAETHVIRRIEMQGLVTGAWYNVLTIPDQGGIAVYWQDITAQKQMEEELRYRTEELQNKEADNLAILDGSFEGSWIVDRLAGTLQCSDKWSQRLGLDKIPDEERLTYTQSLVCQADLANGNSIESLIKNKKTKFDIAYRIKTVDKGYIWTQNRGKIVYDGEGNAIKVYATTTDISELKQAEDAVAFQAHLLSVVNEAVAATDENHIITYWNEAAEKLYGFSASEAIGRLSKEFLDTEMSEALREEAYEQMLAQNYWQGEIVYHRKDGLTILIEVHTKVLRNSQGAFIGTITSSHDITVRKKMEKALRESEEKHRTLFDSMDQGFCSIEVIFDQHGQPVDWLYLETNSEFEKQGGLPNANGQCISALLPEAEESWFRYLGKVAVTGVPMRFENELRALNRWFEVFAFKMGGQDSRTVGMLFTNITDRKKMEKDLQSNKDHALALVKKLEETNRNKNEFLNILSHELRNPLAAISAGLQLMDMSSDTTQLNSAKEIMKRQVGQLGHLIDDLLDLTRINTNKIKIKKERVELNTLAALSAEDNKKLFESNGVDFETQFYPGPISIDADPVRISQVIGNLLHNALKFTGRGGRTALTVKMVKNEAIFSVEDNGVGIKPEILHSIFEPFIQADCSLDRSSGGLGLGLSIAKGIVRQHGGNIWAYSEGQGKGSLFTVSLPAIVEEKYSLDKTRNTEPAKKSLKVIFIDDNRDLADMMCLVAEQMGHCAYAAYTGPDGIEQLKEKQPDVVFCDIGLPGMDGYEVARRIRSEDSMKDTVLVALTGYSGEEEQSIEKECGFDMHAAKPLSNETLKKLLAGIGDPKLI